MYVKPYKCHKLYLDVQMSDHPFSIFVELVKLFEREIQLQTLQISQIYYPIIEHKKLLLNCLLSRYSQKIIYFFVLGNNEGDGASKTRASPSSEH